MRPGSANKMTIFESDSDRCENKTAIKSNDKLCTMLYYAILDLILHNTKINLLLRAYLTEQCVFGCKNLLRCQSVQIFFLFYAMSHQIISYVRSKEYFCACLFYP